MKRTINLDKIDQSEIALIEECIGRCLIELHSRYFKVRENALDTNNDYRLKYANERMDYLNELRTSFSNRPKYFPWQH